MPPGCFVHYGPIIELVYTAVILLFCLMIYYKTKEIYDLTKHRGINAFRNAFLFFGLAYASRVLLHMIMIGRVAFDFHLARKFLMPLSLMIVGFLSTIAVFYLTYSTVWKKIKIKHFMTFALIVAVIVSIVSFAYNTHYIILVLQLVLLVFTLVMSFSKKKHKLSKIRILYLLLFAFWLLNLFYMGPRKLLDCEIKVVLQAISFVVFGLIYYKLYKLIK